MSAPIPLSFSQNHLLASFSDESAAAIQPHLEPVTLDHRFYLERPLVAIEYVYFLESGLGSVVANGNGGRRVEVGIFGRDGMSGAMVVMGSDRSPHECYMQLAGSGWRIASDTFREIMRRNPELRDFLLKYVQAFMTQTAQTALANGRAKLEERLARWLLMCHDRIDGDALSLTHEFLSVMLGVRRAGVTVAIHDLERQGLIGTGRRTININDREGLLEIANGSYGLSEAEYERLLGDKSDSTAIPPKV